MRRKRGNKVLVSVFGGLLVTLTGVAIDVSLLPWEKTVLSHQVMGDFIAGLMAVLVCLAIQLKSEEMYYETAMERAAIVAELNHHVRNAVFPLFLALQKSGDADANRIATEAMERINMALRDATTDAFTNKVDYSVATAANKAA